MEGKMKRLLAVFLAAVLLLPLGMALAKQAPSGNANYTLPGGGGSEATTPHRDIRLVRTGFLGVTAIGRNTSRYAIFSGEALVWDTNSSDGITVTTTTTSPDLRFAGVAVTSFETDDVNGIDGENGGVANWGYVVIQGWALASVDVAATAGATVGLNTAAHEGALTPVYNSAVGGFQIQSVDAVAIPLGTT